MAVWNRTPSGPRRWPMSSACATPRPDPRELIVNATSVGMHGEDCRAGRPGRRGARGGGRPGLRRRPTPLCGWAEQRGARVVDGLEVLLRQGPAASSAGPAAGAARRDARRPALNPARAACRYRWQWRSPARSFSRSSESSCSGPPCLPCRTPVTRRTATPRPRRCSPMPRRSRHRPTANSAPQQTLRWPST